MKKEVNKKVKIGFSAHTYMYAAAGVLLAATIAHLCMCEWVSGFLSLLYTGIAIYCAYLLEWNNHLEKLFDFYEEVEKNLFESLEKSWSIHLSDKGLDIIEQNPQECNCRPQMSGGLIASMPKTFTRDDLKQVIQEKNLKCPAKKYIYKWKHAGLIVETSKNNYEKVEV